MRGYELPDSVKRNPVGVQFAIETNNRTDSYTVIDIYTTVNQAGELVSRDLLCVNTFNGQRIESRKPVTTLLRSEIVSAPQ